MRDGVDGNNNHNTDIKGDNQNTNIKNKSQVNSNTSRTPKRLSKNQGCQCCSII